MRRTRALASKVCVLTTGHNVFDARIFHKQAKSLVEAGFEVLLIAQHCRDEMVDGVRIVALPKPRNRLTRILGTLRIFNIARSQRADVYHIHDPELLPAAMLLKIVGRPKTIYDIHENVKEDILTKLWLPKIVRRPLSLAYRLMERVAFLFIDEIVIAEDSYAKNYPNRRNITSIRNYPRMAYFNGTVARRGDRPTVVYVGVVCESRGILELLESTKLLKPKCGNVLLRVVGDIRPDVLRGKLQQEIGNKGIRDNVSLNSRVEHENIADILSDSSIGLAILHAEPNHVESLPTKLFEYMASGLPVVASNFTLWRDIVDAEGCGITVDPLEPQDIATAIQYLLDHPAEAARMGANGKKAVHEKYNWEAEQVRLVDLYHMLLAEDVT